MKDKETGLIFFLQLQNGLHVAPLSDMSNGVWLMCAFEENTIAKSKWRTIKKHEICMKSISDCMHVVQSNQIEFCQVSPEDMKLG